MDVERSARAARGVEEGERARAPAKVCLGWNGRKQLITLLWQASRPVGRQAGQASRQAR